MQQGIIDLNLDPIWAAEFTPENAQNWTFEVKAEKTDKGTRTKMVVTHTKGGKEYEAEVNAEGLMQLTSLMLQAIFLSVPIPNEGIPPQLRGDIRIAGMWAQSQAQNFLPFMIQKIIGQLEADGKTWAVDPSYAPNIVSSNIIGLDGRKPETWDGSFRPVLRLREIRLPEYKPTEDGHDNQGRDDVDPQAVGANSAQVGGD